MKRLIVTVTFLAASAIALAGTLDEAAELYKAGKKREAFTVFLGLAVAGDPHAQAAVGIMYLQGDGIPKSEKKAIEWFEKSAAQGKAESQYQLGALYAQGKAGPEKQKLSCEYLEKAAAQDHKKAKLMLPLCGQIAPATGTDKMETDSFELQLPSGWVVKEYSKPAKVVGPKGESAQFSSYVITGQGSEQEKAQVRLKLKENLKNAIVASLDDPGLTITEKFQEKESKSAFSAYTLLSQKARTTDDTRYLNAYALVGATTALLITVQGATKDYSNAGMFEYQLKSSIKWK